jgi:DNA-binding IclR family transcriptional regulator
LCGTLIGSQGVVLDQALGVHNFKFSIDLGTRFSLHTAAPGKAILALLPQDESDKIISEIEFAAHTPNTLTSASAFKEHLKEVKEQGFGVDCDEEMEGQRCIGAAIVDGRDYPIGAIWMTGPSNRIPKRDFKRLGTLCLDHAKAISEKLKG